MYCIILCMTYKLEKEIRLFSHLPYKFAFTHHLELQVKFLKPLT